ncbi:hypothetical protein [Paraferrimonas haliotis]|uniref:Uncharacterized protein n=1 Tax=Paraferrimonas haliotis TaxID=2013866 RepID=A0AA37TYI8_9GAMM|nr:hypothetical protein [Paraferrimonas haliotis]GLS83606.1 hypothetical protein GCM10007894_15830 [Paraferrimonas haliotis]
MSNFIQVRDVLKRHQQLHQDLAEKYRQLGSRANDGRDGMLFDLLSEHQLRMANAIKSYKEQASLGVVNTFFQFTEDPTKTDAITAFTDSDTAHQQEVEQLTMALDEQLLSIYANLRETSATHEVQELFDNLCNHLQQQKIRLATDLATLPDL